MTGKTVAAFAGLAAGLALLFGGKKSKAAPSTTIVPTGGALPSTTSKPQALSAPVPPSFRRITEAELTPDLQQAANDALSSGLEPGHFYPFNRDGVNYGLLVERTAAGRVVVSLAVEA